MEDTVDDSQAMPHVDGAVSDTSGSGESGIHTGAVGAQNGIAIDQRPKLRSDVFSIQFGEFEVGRLPAAVPHDENGNLFSVNAPLARYAAPAAS